MTKPKRKVTAKKPEALFGRVVTILEQARGNVVRAVNTNMVLAYWLIGREIVQQVQGGEKRAKYGEQLVKDLAARLTEHYGQGFSKRNLHLFMQFYLSFSERYEIVRPMGAQSEATAKVRPLGAQLAEMGIRHPTGDESSALAIFHPMGGESTKTKILSPTGRELVSPEKSSTAGSPLTRGFSPQLSGRITAP